MADSERNPVRVVSDMMKGKRTQYLVEWDAEPFFSYEASRPEFEELISNYEKVRKGTSQDYPCVFSMDTRASLLIEEDEKGEIVVFLGSKEVGKDDLTALEKRVALDELESLFYSEFGKKKEETGIFDI